VLEQLLAADRLVDLTRPLGPATVLWPGTPAFEATALARHETDGAYYRALRLGEHDGTHIDAPAHFAPGGTTVDELPLAQLVRPAIRLDARDLVGGDPRYVVSAADLRRLGDEQAPLREGCALLVHTGWDAYADDAARYVGASGDDDPAFPGLGPDAATLLVERGVAGLGIDTLGIDPGHASGFPAHRITQPAGLWHLEGLVNLDRVPAEGAWLVVGALPLVAGSGAPARVFAILPPG
jgi:kynurenine formamidase